MAAPPFVIDASIWIHIWRHHPPDIFFNLWEQLRASIKRGEIISPDEVLHELKRGSDDLADLLATEEGLFVPLDEDIQEAVSIVMAECPDLADEEGERNRADPFVVAVGLKRGCNVVTRERPRKSATARRKIPDACEDLSVECLDWFDFLRAVGWKL